MAAFTACLRKDGPMCKCHRCERYRPLPVPDPRAPHRSKGPCPYCDTAYEDKQVRSQLQLQQALLESRKKEELECEGTPFLLLGLRQGSWLV